MQLAAVILVSCALAVRFFLPRWMAVKRAWLCA